VVEAAVEVEAVVEAVVEDAVNKDGGILFGVLNVLDSNKLRYISNKLFQCFEC
jgi:hypothetical protein